MQGTDLLLLLEQNGSSDELALSSSSPACGAGPVGLSHAFILHLNSAVFISRDFSNLQAAAGFPHSLLLNVAVKSSICAQPDIAYEVTCLFLRENGHQTAAVT